MTAAVLAGLLGGGWPLWLAWRAGAGTTLRGALPWLAAAWLAWLAVAADILGAKLGPYLALSLTGCAGVAVLGMRRPGAGAWQAVVGGLLLVLLLPVAEGLGEPRLDSTRLPFLGATLVAAVGNYLPTRFGLAALAAGGGCGLELARLAGADVPELLGRGLMAAVPWLALAATWRAPAASAFDREWLAFRDRFGFLWGMRQREQFNRAVEHAGLGVVLGWGGAIPAEGAGDAALVLLRATLQRFRAVGESPERGER
jgi:hypothetical protein